MDKLDALWISTGASGDHDHDTGRRIAKSQSFQKLRGFIKTHALFTMLH